MTRARFGWLVASAWWRLVRFDIAALVTGDAGLGSPAAPPDPPRSNAALEAALLRAMTLACCLYWKPVLCLQRSVCAARLLRAHGLPARLVIGYRPSPFLSHAWVEIDGRVVNDSPAFAQRLQVLYVA